MFGLKVRLTMLPLKLIILFFIIAAAGREAPLIETSNGWLQGTLQKSYNGRTFSSFEGIPYAKPPIGELRFEAPKEPYNWTRIWIANTKHTCLYSVGSTVIGDEDCLYINVYVPREKPNPFDNLNVIVHIHGGGFMMWNDHFYAGPNYLMDEEVVLVTMNYRLGLFGFLSTGDDVVPGNNGMKDQTLSLKWIQQNIKYFGGNPNSVTLTGMLAGASSVHLHYFSPLSKGLFHRGVSQSGTALNPWAIETEPLTKTKHLAESIGCPVETSRLMVDCLKSRSGNSIVSTQKLSIAKGVFEPPAFLPVIERQHDGAFLTEYPYKMLLDKSVTDLPWIVSMTEEEGRFPINIMNKSIPELYEQFDNIAPNLLMYNYLEETQKELVTKKIKEYYLKEPDSAEDIIKLISDRYFAAGSDMSAKLQAKANKSPIYFYIFGYRGQHSFLDFVVSNTSNLAATHGDDVQYYLHTSTAEEKLSESDENMKSLFLRWLVAYANGEELKLNELTWKSITGSEILEFLYIYSPEEIYLETAEGLGSNVFWSKLPLKENELRKKIKDEL